MGLNDANEIYNLFNAMIKHCYKVSLKASPQSIIKNSLPDSKLAERVADIMEYMESLDAREEDGHIRLKAKIKSIYQMI